MINRLGALFLVVAMIRCDNPAVGGCGSGASGAAVESRGPPGRDALWPNEPLGLTVVSDVSLGTRSDDGWRCEGAGLSIATDATTPMSSSAIVFTYGPGFGSGYAPGVAYFNLSTPTPETYFGFWWKPSNPWQSHPSGVNKIALLFPATSEAGTIYVMMFFDGTKYTIQVEPTFAADTRRLEPNVTATPVELGKWHQIEWYVRYSTSGTSRDGVVRWWLDGVPQGAYTDLQTPSDAGFTEYTIRPVWGGAPGDVKKQNDSYSYGRVRIRRR
jgi:hypothetical protein